MHGEIPVLYLSSYVSSRARERRCNGRSVSHSHRVVNRKFKPNIQHVSVVVDGHRQKMNVCTTCLKSGKVARS